MDLARRYGDFTNTQLGEHFGGMHRTSVIYGLRALPDLLKHDPDLANVHRRADGALAMLTSSHPRGPAPDRVLIALSEIAA